MALLRLQQRAARLECGAGGPGAEAPSPWPVPVPALSPGAVEQPGEAPRRPFGGEPSPPASWSPCLAEARDGAARRRPRAPPYSSMSPEDRRRFGLDDSGSGSEEESAFEAPAAPAAASRLRAAPAPAEEGPAWSSLSAEDRRRFGLLDADDAACAPCEDGGGPEEVSSTRSFVQTLSLLEADIPFSLAGLLESERQLETARTMT